VCGTALAGLDPERGCCTPGPELWAPADLTPEVELSQGTFGKQVRLSVVVCEPVPVGEACSGGP